LETIIKGFTIPKEVSKKDLKKGLPRKPKKKGLQDESLFNTSRSEILIEIRGQVRMDDPKSIK